MTDGGRRVKRIREPWEAPPFYELKKAHKGSGQVPDCFVRVSFGNRILAAAREELETDLRRTVAGRVGEFSSADILTQLSYAAPNVKRYCASSFGRL